MGLSLIKKDIEDVANCLPGAIEEVLKKVYAKLTRYAEGQNKQEEKKGSSDGFKMENFNGNKIVSSEQNYKELLLQKDRIIYELKSTLEVIECNVRF